MLRSVINRLIIDGSGLRSIPINRFVTRSRGGGQRQGSVKWRKWTPLPLGVGVGYIAYWQYGNMRETDARKMAIIKDPKPFKPWQVYMYKSLPLRFESRIFGWISRLELPVFLREPLIGLFARAVGCELTEAVEEDLKKYRSLNEFFRRTVKPHLRPVANDAMVSPADGVLQVCGRLTNDRIEQVKGYSYSLGAFIGEDLVQKLKSGLKKSPDTQLYYCVVYLSPANCHQFFSPVRWDIDQRRHFSGYLLGVNRKIISRVPHLFSINERVLLTGQWEHGFFSMTPVGATHVGSIVLDCEKSLITNSASKHIGDVDHKKYESAIPKGRGDMIGEFNMGSSVVLIFEAPESFKFCAKAGDRLKYGESLGRL
jgi:phosphatidylserine decarboxylase